MRVAVGRIIVHAFLVLYATVLIYVIFGLVFNYYIDPNVFFGLSFALLIFAFIQAFFELGIGRALLYALIASTIGFLSELLGTSTGIPFGKYSYGDLLGPKVLGVPVVVPLTWFVISYIALSMIKGRINVSKHAILSTAALAAFGVMSWDFLIDPMFSSQSYAYWTWSSNQPIESPRLSGVPITNFLGWFTIAFLMVSIFLYLERRESKIIRRSNSLDSFLVYFLLLVDGAVANYALGHSIIIALGVGAMLTFLSITLFRAVRSKKIATLEAPAISGDK